MFHFFVEKAQMVDEKTLIITGSDYNHIANVLRMKIGEELSVSLRDDEDGKEYRYGIEEITEDSVICRLRFIKEDGLELPSQIVLFQCLPKADKMELVIQKAVELGAFSVVPVASKRCVVKLDEKKAASKVKRWQAISESAAKQSKRRIIPEVRMPMPFKLAVQYAADMDVKLFPYEMAEGMARTKELVSGVREGQKIAVFIGPEGGFSDEEVEYARENGFEPITLGKRILRTETAGLAIISWLMYQLER